MKKTRSRYPLVSIITVCLNSEKHLEQTIQSVINQMYDNIEYIIIDGGSNDNTLNIIKKYEVKIDYWLSENDEGIYDALNKGLNIAHGDYVLCLNADDYLSDDNAIDRAIRLGLEGGENPLLIAGQIRIAFGDELWDWVWPTSKDIIQRYNPAHPATLISKKIYSQMFYIPSFKITGDAELWFRLKAKGFFQPKFIPSVISVHRLGGVSTQASAEYYKCVEKEIARYLNFKTFSHFRLIRNLFLVFMKKMFIVMWGEKNYYKYFHRGIYLFRKRFFS